MIALIGFAPTIVPRTILSGISALPGPAVCRFKLPRRYTDNGTAQLFDPHPGNHRQVI